MNPVRAASLLMNHDANGGAWIGFSRMIEAVKEGARVAEASRAAAPPTRRAEA